jgi:hypothetical protein
MFEYRIDPSDFPEDYDDDVDIVCKNCSTIHSLNDNAEDKTETTLRADLAEARAKAVELAGEVDETILRCENCEHEYVSGCSEPCISCIAGDEITRKHHSKYAAAKTAADVLKEWG